MPQDPRPSARGHFRISPTGWESTSLRVSQRQGLHRPLPSLSPAKKEQSRTPREALCLSKGKTENRRAAPESPGQTLRTGGLAPSAGAWRGGEAERPPATPNLGLCHLQVLSQIPSSKAALSGGKTCARSPGQTCVGGPGERRLRAHGPRMFKSRTCPLRWGTVCSASAASVSLSVKRG